MNKIATKVVKTKSGLLAAFYAIFCLFYRKFQRMIFDSGFCNNQAFPFSSVFQPDQFSRKSCLFWHRLYRKTKRCGLQVSLLLYKGKEVESARFCHRFLQRDTALNMDARSRIKPQLVLNLQIRG